MLRRHASGLRALLMLTDGALAPATMVLTAIIRFGADWHVHGDCGPIRDLQAIR